MKIKSILTSFPFKVLFIDRLIKFCIYILTDAWEMFFAKKKVALLPKSGEVVSSYLARKATNFRLLVILAATVCICLLTG
jgi:hypothetical protein